MLFAAASPIPDAVASFLLGVVALGFIWVIVVIIKSSIEPKHELWYNGYEYSTKRAHRIFGKVSERISDGHYIACIKSLWKCYESKYGAMDRYFILILDELRPAKIKPIDAKTARQFIIDNVSTDFGEKLLRDWFKQPPVRTPGNGE